MQILPNFVDMRKTSKELAEDKAAPAVADYPQDVYPWGLCISLCQDELEKLELSDDVEVGDLIHMHSIGRVTSVSKNDTTQGTSMRVEIQITDIALENESHENEDAEEAMEQGVDYRKFYKDKA